jgi:hypothetical protein
MSVGLTVPLDVAGELGGPPGRVVGGSRLVLRASVPEAAVDEDCDLRPREKDVRPATRHAREGGVDAVSEPLMMQLTSKNDLGLRIACGLSGHPNGRCRENIDRLCCAGDAATARCGRRARDAGFGSVTFHGGHFAIMLRVDGVGSA